MSSSLLGRRIGAPSLVGSSRLVASPIASASSLLTRRIGARGLITASRPASPVPSTLRALHPGRCTLSAQLEHDQDPKSTGLPPKQPSVGHHKKDSTLPSAITQDACSGVRLCPIPTYLLGADPVTQLSSPFPTSTQAELPSATRTVTTSSIFPRRPTARRSFVNFHSILELFVPKSRRSASRR